MNQQQTTGMTPIEARATFSLAGIFSLRMLGLFLILPVFALYANELEGVTPLLIGLAIGAYGLTQALFQIPFGMLSDRIGRKPVIIGGLLIFALGSVIAAEADTIYEVIFGRTVQGAGAIAAAVMALLADLTREQKRMRAMAVIGMTIGFAFAISLILGPLLNRWIGVPGIFWLTAVLALAGIGITLFWVPNPKVQRRHRDAEAAVGQFRRVLTDPDLLRLDLGIFTLHMILTSLFIGVPLALVRNAGLAADHHWALYLPVVVLAMGFMIPFVVIAENRRKMKQVFVGAIALLVVAQLGLWLFINSMWGMGFALLLFFTAFNLLEATLPSLIAKTAPVVSKGTAMGVYSTSQFIGAFLGGVVGGTVLSYFDLPALFLFGAGVALVWLIVASTMAKPSYLSSHLINVGPMDGDQARLLEMQMSEIEGVGDALVEAEEGVAYLKIDSGVIDMNALDEFSQVVD